MWIKELDGQIVEFFQRAQHGRKDLTFVSEDSKADGYSAEAHQKVINRNVAKKVQRVNDDKVRAETDNLLRATKEAEAITALKAKGEIPEDYTPPSRAVSG